MNYQMQPFGKQRLLEALAKDGGQRRDDGADDAVGAEKVRRHSRRTDDVAAESLLHITQSSPLLLMELI